MNPIVDIIRRQGSVPFSRYQDLALYHPEHGFFSRPENGAGRDFVTSPELGTLFAECLASALDTWWRTFDEPEQMYFVDVGCARGTLLQAMRAAQPSSRYRLLGVERSSAMAAHEGIATRTNLPDDLTDECGIVFANELLDNLPLDIFEWRNGAWFAVHVAAGETNELVEVLIPADQEQVELLGQLVERPHQGLRFPLQRSAVAWIQQAQTVFARGLVVAIDYGRSAAQFVTADQSEWLRNYAKHGRRSDLYSQPGSCDITCDVSLDELALHTPPVENASQATFLAECGIAALASSEGPAESRWPQALRIQAATARMRQMEALVDRQGLGGFRVLQWASKKAGC